MNIAARLIDGASSGLAIRRAPTSMRAVSADVVALQRAATDEPRPSRIGGAPLTGALAVSAYQRTAAIDAVMVLSRIDEHV